jgi:hypothetical protein
MAVRSSDRCVPRRDLGKKGQCRGQNFDTRRGDGQTGQTAIVGLGAAANGENQ